MPRRLGQLLLVATLGPSLAVAGEERPNILVILADDLGFSDLGCYGSEVRTPTLDRLAAGGVRMNQFYNTAKCHSSRVSLLTGRYPYQAGNTALDKAVTFAEVLRGVGYFTAMGGKWHLDREPTDFGFDRYFGHLSGASDYFRGNDSYRLNGEPWPIPKSGFYTTTAVTDYALRFLEEAREESDRPWLLYMAYNAPHAPLQAPEEDYRRYEHAYDAGWQAIRQARIEKQRELGLFPAGSEPSPQPDHLPDWEAISPKQQAWEKRRMATYAAMIDRLDREIGRLIADLEAAGELDNTLIVFASDNGASPFERTVGRSRDPWETTGPPTNWHTGTAWAWVSNTPFRYYKQQQFEGGVATPGILHWPAAQKAKAGDVTNAVGHLIDVLPTVLDAAGANYPASWPGREIGSPEGVSLLPLLGGEAAAPSRELYFLFGQDRAIRDGDLKLVSFRRNPWRLYDLSKDRTETTDLADAMPAERDRLIERWRELAAEKDGAPKKLRQPVRRRPGPAVHPEWTRYELAEPATQGQEGS